MRKADLPQPSRKRIRLSRQLHLPESVYREFVGSLFEMGLPVFGMGIVYASVALISADILQDALIRALAALGLALTAWRLLTIRRYRKGGEARDVATLRRWERRYALGTYGLALLLALLNVRVLGQNQAALHMVTISLVFGYGAGVVARVSVRPRICVTSMLFATVPTILALLAHAGLEDAGRGHFQLFVVEAVLLAVITALSIQTVFHMYRTAVRHLVTEHDMTQLAKRDALTGLGNRLHLREAFESKRSALDRADARFAMLCLDLDGFKPVNDRLGHPAGDALLREVARRLETSVRDGDVIVRLGGDEFAILQAGVGHGSEAELLGRRIIRALSRPYDLEGQTANVSASVGVALAPTQRLDLDELLAEADAALYRAKADGKGRVRLSTRQVSGSSRIAA